MINAGRTLVIGAMPQEINLFLDALEMQHEHVWGEYRFTAGLLQNHEIILVRSGIGKVLSAMVSQYAISNFKPSRVIFTGLAGALSDNLKIGDVVVAETLIQHDIDVSALGFKRGHIPYSDIYLINTDRKLLEAALEFKSPKFKVSAARILSGDQFIAASQRSQMQYLVDELKGDCVEMEGASVALVAQHNKIPCLIVRTISDRADGDAPLHFNEFLDAAAHHSFDLVSHLLYHIGE